MAKLGNVASILRVLWDIYGDALGVAKGNVFVNVYEMFGKQIKLARCGICCKMFWGTLRNFVEVM